MPLYISTANGNDGPVFFCMKEVARCDPGLYTDVYASDPIAGALRIRFEPRGSMTQSKKFLQNICNVDPPITVVGVGSGYIVEPKFFNEPDDGPPSGKAIVQTGGGWTRIFRELDGSVLVIIDLEDGYGKHYLAPGTTGTVYDPLPTILFHELSHAWHYIANDDTHKAGAKYATKEVAARSDENVFRQELNLPLLDVHNDTDPGFGIPTQGGLNFPSCAGKYPGWDCGCHIATATLGARVDRRIAAFGRAKQQLDSLTIAGVSLLEPMSSTYQLFSPMVAGDVRAEPELREAMRHFAIQPSVHLLQLVRAHLTMHGDAVKLASEAARCVDDYRNGLPVAAGEQIGAAATAARRASGVLWGFDVPCETLSVQAPAADIFARVVTSVRAVGAEPTGIAWLFEGLSLFLAAAEDHCYPPDLVSRLGGWFARIPIPENIDWSLLREQELIALRHTLLHRPVDYDTFVGRVRAAELSSRTRSLDPSTT